MKIGPMNIQFPLAEIIDYEVLGKISFEHVEKYLLQNGWHLTRATELAAGWRSPDGQRNMLVPRTTEVVDYCYRIGDCIKSLAVYEKRSQINVWLDLMNLNQQSVG